VRRGCSLKINLVNLMVYPVSLGVPPGSLV
jgi:hypothetical protein